mgnify:CR=1 FL=1|jgi:hypothetical protein
MTGDSQLILLMIAGVHLLGLACVAVLMVTALRANPDDPPHSTNSDGDDGRGNKPRQPRAPSGQPRGGIPLPDAEPALVRLRDHTRLGDHLPRRERRTVREPDRRPVRT